MELKNERETVTIMMSKLPHIPPHPTTSHHLSPHHGPPHHTSRNGPNRRRRIKAFIASLHEDEERDVARGQVPEVRVVGVVREKVEAEHRPDEDVEPEWGMSHVWMSH